MTQPPPIDLTTSARVTAPTRAALRRRLDSSSSSAPEFLSPTQYAQLCVVVDRLVPQDPTGPNVAIAAEIDRRRARRAGDGWRYAELPPDGEALVAGLARLDAEARHRHGVAFVGLAGDAQDELLAAVRDGAVRWTGFAAARWFEELLAECVEMYVADPRTLAAMRFDALAFLPRWNEVGLNAPAPGSTQEPANEPSKASSTPGDQGGTR